MEKITYFNLCPNNATQKHYFKFFQKIKINEVINNNYTQSLSYETLCKI